MKTNFLYCLLFLGSFLMACEKTEMDDFSPKTPDFFPIGMEALPEEAVDYLNANFSGLSILKVEKHAEIGFKVLMSNQLQVVFDTSGSFLFSQQKEDSDDDIPVAIGDLPASIRDFVSKNYPELKIVWAELDEGTYEVYLNNGWELYFDQNGVFIRADRDDDWVDPLNLPEAVLDYIQNNYPDATIIKAELDEGIYEIYLNNGWELYFDQNGNFIRADRDELGIDPLSLPKAILDYIQNNYPDATIIRAELDEGTYEIYLNNGWELYFDQNGNFLFSEID